jgi:hypothetical protein
MKVHLFKILGVYNDGKDNIDNNLIVCVKDIINSTKDKYEIEDLIGMHII